MFRVLITGASQGIGEAIAYEYARRGAAIIIAARTQSKLEKVAAECKKRGASEVQVLSVDLSSPEGWAKTVAAATAFKIDTLVNNAGYGMWGNFLDSSLDEVQKNMRLNMDALVQMTHQLIPVLQQHKKSYILNVSSTTAYQAIPTFAVYAASKSFVLSWSRAIHHELKKLGITVTVLVPGSTDTGFIERAGMQHMHETAKKVNMTSEDVACIGVHSLLKGRIEVIPGLINKISAQATGFIPKKWIECTAASIYLKK